MNEEIYPDEFFKKEKRIQTPYYPKEGAKSAFQTICSRLNTTCNKEICLFIDAFNEKHKEVLTKKRK